MTSRHPLPGSLLTALLLLTLTGCFKSLTLQASSESSSKAVSSPFKSSSNSSSPGDEEEEEVSRDVRDATALWAIRGGADIDALRRDVGRVAREYGVTDWERHAATYRGIGRGLRRSQLEGEVLAGVVTELAAGEPQARGWIEAGYQHERLN